MSVRQMLPKTNAPKTKGFKLPSLPFFKKKETFVRRHARHDCCIIAGLYVTERHFEMDGAVLEISQGGALFRPASTYILDRTGERVAVRFEELEVPGTIMNVRPQGYGVKFDEGMPEDTIEALVSQYGLRTGRSAA